MITVRNCGMRRTHCPQMRIAAQILFANAEYGANAERGAAAVCFDNLAENGGNHVAKNSGNLIAETAEISYQ